MSDSNTIHFCLIFHDLWARTTQYPGEFVVVCWSLTSLCHSNGHIETMPAREINPFTALTRISWGEYLTDFHCGRYVFRAAM